METKTKKPFLSVDVLESLQKIRKQELETLTATIAEKEAVLSRVVRETYSDSLEHSNVLGRKSNTFNLEAELQALQAKKKSLMERIATNGEVVLYSEIRMLAQRYALRFLPSSSYSSYYPHGMGQAIEDCKAKNEITSQVEGFILAPSKAFKLENRDPILFIKPTNWMSRMVEDDDKYYVVKKWGKDFTIFRRILGAVGPWFYTRCVTLMVLAIAAIIGLRFAMVATSNFTDSLLFIVGILVGIVGLAMPILQMCIHQEDPGGASFWYSREKWNSDRK